MKNIIMALGLFAPTAFISAQDRDRNPPDQVQQSFHKDYPHADHPRWNRSHDQWHANFDDRGNNGEMVAHYDTKGQRVDSHIPWDDADVPSAIKDRLRHQYRGARGFLFTKIESGSGDDYFQIDMRWHGRNTTAFIDEHGEPRQDHERHW